MPFKKGHKSKGGRKKKLTNEIGKKKAGALTLDTYFITHSRFSKRKKGEITLDQAKIDYYINNDLDITELLDD